jgi:uncharacterized protein (TIGR02117 family)
MRALRRVLVGLAIVVGLVVLGTVVPRPFSAPEQGAPTRRILVIANPIHTDIAVVLDAELMARLPWLADASLPFAQPGTAWVMFGWGARAFYIETPTWDELKPGPLFKAFTLDDSVMHVLATGDIDIGHPAVTAFDLDERSYTAMLDFIAASFVTDADGRPMEIVGKGYTPFDRFFEAHDSFNAFVGCNIWTAKALRIAGLQTGWWNPLPQSLAVSLELHN